MKNDKIHKNPAAALMSGEETMAASPHSEAQEKSANAVDHESFTSSVKNSASTIVVGSPLDKRVGCAESSATDDGKIPPLDLGEARLTPVKAPIVRVDNPNVLASDAAADKVAAPPADASVAIKAIAAAMDIDTRLAHALVDIQAGVDTAEAIARAYGVALPAKEGANIGDVRPESHTETKVAEAESRVDAAAAASRLPDQVASVPTFLCNPRRGFWD